MRLRVYFNRRMDAPFVGSVDYGSPSSEINVREIHLKGVTGKSRYEARGYPCFWIEIDGRLEVKDEVATIYPE